MPSLERAIAGVPRGLCGVVFRHDGAAGRAALLRRTARQCRERRAALVVAGTVDGAPGGTGRHWRGGRGCRPARGLVTSSAHGFADLVRARRAGAALAFLSPVFPTASHRGARTLGPAAFARMAVRAGLPVLALGGISGRTAGLLPRFVAGAGAVEALLP
ncbi:MAG: hypothetical protein NVSMB18_02340 [Acetobacteraceae bacterium]